jgi:hypothetical protein
MAYKIKFFRRIVQEIPVLVEDAPVDDLDAIVEFAKERLDDLRYRMNPPPHTFIIVDEKTGAEIRRWTDPEVR